MFRKALIIAAVIAPFNGVLLKDVAAGALDFRIAKDMAEITFLTQSASFGYGGADMGFGVLFNQDNDYIAHGSILVSGTSSGDLKALHFGVGAKLYGGKISGPDNKSYDTSGGSVAIGGQLRYVFPGSTPFAVLGEAFYAPEVTSFSGFDGLYEYRFAVELEVTPSARAYLGYRNMEVRFDKSGRVNYDVDDSAHIGIRFEF